MKTLKQHDAAGAAAPYVDLLISAGPDTRISNDARVLEVHARREAQIFGRFIRTTGGKS